MLNKTIYISDADLPIFELAQRLAGVSLSVTIVEALRQFVGEHGDAETAPTKFEQPRGQAQMPEKGMRAVEVKVRKVAYAKRRFTGRSLATGYEMRSKKKGELPTVYEVFETAKGNLALYVSIAPDWADCSHPQVKSGLTNIGEARRYFEDWRN